MSGAKIIFHFEGINITIYCSLEDKIKDICENYVTLLESNINSFLFLYEGNQVNMQLRFNEQADLIDIKKEK